MSCAISEARPAGFATAKAASTRSCRSFELTPEAAGLPRTSPDALKGGDAAHNAEALRRVLEGERSAFRDAAAITAGAAMVVAGEARDIREGVVKAAEAIDSGSALRALDTLVKVSNS